MLEVADMSMPEYAEAITKRIGQKIHYGMVQARIAGKNSLPPDEDDLPAWADALKLTGFHREKFFRLALIERTPGRIRKLIGELESRLEANEKRLRSLEKELADANRTADALSVELSQATAQASRLLEQQPKTG
jgi:hypothetical protein